MIVFVPQDAPPSPDPLCQPLHGQALPKVHRRTIQPLPTFAGRCLHQKPQSLFSPVLCPVISQSVSWHFRFHLDFRRLVPLCRLTLSLLSHRHLNCSSQHGTKFTNTHTFLYLYFTHLCSIRQKGWELCLSTDHCVLSMKSGPAMGTR